jgi:23S rRNA-/tRNA-specific pseudouridylate synthase
MKIKVLYEDASILAIEKPAGITVSDLVLKYYPETELAHRLDKDTSGVLLLAKNEKAHEFLKKQFQARTVKKIYHAVVDGFVGPDHGIINKPIGRSPSDFRRRLSGRGARGEMREAETSYKVLKRFTAPVQASAHENFSPYVLRSLGKKNSRKPTLSKFTYLEIKPKTGRTHQIRVHMKFLNHPVACDSLYAPNNLCPKGFSRLALHAKSIEFKNLKGKVVKIESPLPKEFLKIL